MSAVLVQHHVETLDFIYSRFASAVREQGATPIYFYLPALDGTTPESAEQRRLADEAGFLVLDFDHVYGGRRPEELQLTRGDYLHPNAAGHGMIADALYQELVNTSGPINVRADARGR